MNPVSLEWVIGSVTAINFGILAILFSLAMQNRTRLNKHEVSLSKFDGIPSKMDNLESQFKLALEKHEVKEDRQFAEMMHKVERLVISVALLTKSTDVIE